MAKPLERGTKPFSRVRRAPVLRKQLSDLVDGMIGQASENIAWIDEGLHLMPLASRLSASAAAQAGAGLKLERDEVWGRWKRWSVVDSPWSGHRLTTAMRAGASRGLRGNMGFLLVSVAKKYEARHQKETRGSPSEYSAKTITFQISAPGGLTTSQRPGLIQRCQSSSDSSPRAVECTRRYSPQLLTSTKMNNTPPWISK